jgi:hypothetical protein
LEGDSHDNFRCWSGLAFRWIKTCRTVYCGNLARVYVREQILWMRLEAEILHFLRLYRLPKLVDTTA